MQSWRHGLPLPQVPWRTSCCKKGVSRTPTEDLAPEAQSTARTRAVVVQRAGLAPVSAVVGELGSQRQPNGLATIGKRCLARVAAQGAAMAVGGGRNGERKRGAGHQCP